jgi:hypothetical protein
MATVRSFAMPLKAESITLTVLVAVARVTVTVLARVHGGSMIAILKGRKVGRLKKLLLPK